MSMASRQLALSMRQGLRAQRAIRAVKPGNVGLTRSLATPVSHGSTTESTTLSNGFTVSASKSVGGVDENWRLMGQRLDCLRILPLRPD